MSARSERCKFCIRQQLVGSEMIVVKDGKAEAKICIKNADADKVMPVAEMFSSYVKKVTGTGLDVALRDELPADEKGIILLLGGDGDPERCEIEADGNSVRLLAPTAAALYFAVAHILEKDLGIIFCRGGGGEARAEFVPTGDFEITNGKYVREPAFSYRCWNICGVGSEGESHRDDGTAEYISLNGNNALFEKVAVGKYPLSFTSASHKTLHDLNDLIPAHPEYFMTAPDGKPMVSGAISFLNYYERGAAEALAERMADAADEFARDNDEIFWTMPDDAYFRMTRGGERLSDEPFTADDGTVVRPEDKNYKSTVYFNFINRVVEKLNVLRPGTRISVFAYIYSEPAPAIDVDPRVTVLLAPIHANDRYAFTDEVNAETRENIAKWTEKAEKLRIYTYWNCFRGDIYSRPILNVVKADLLWFKTLGIDGVVMEGKVDCRPMKDMSDAQASALKFYDLNEAYIWAMNKLLWDPEEDTEELLDRYCKTVYKECAAEMREYFALIQKGWDASDAFVWYPTGGDVYYLQFVINAGVKDAVIAALDAAAGKAVSPSVKRKAESVRETVEEYIKKYENFVTETAEVYYCAGGEEEIMRDPLGEGDGNVWNKAKPLTVLRNYDTMEFYPEEAEFSCKMIYDDENIYIAYAIRDDEIAKEDFSCGTYRIYREDGKEVISYAETYIGGNTFNRSVYYGYISGFMGKEDPRGQFYLNDGTPKALPIPEGVKDVKFARVGGKKEERRYMHIQKIPFAALDASKDTFTPYGSFVYYTDRYGRAGWMGYGLWSKQNFSEFRLSGEKERKGECK